MNALTRNPAARQRKSEDRTLRRPALSTRTAALLLAASAAKRP